MYWLVEDTEQLKVFYNSGFKEAYIEIISNNDNTHPAINDLCAVYIRPLQSSKGFMLCINHSEAINVEKDWVYKILSKFDTLYCKDKKLILHYFVLQNLEDVVLPNVSLEFENIPAYNIFYSKYFELSNVNQLIPIVKHYEWCEQIYDKVKPLFKQEKDKYYEFYNNKSSVVFNALERAGIKIDTELFTDYFYATDNDRVYTQYNLNTLTTRPSNKFKGVNYAALNKKTGERRAFIPKNNIFVEYDIVASHINLAAKLIDYSFSDPDVHLHFSKMYKVDRQKAKELTFTQLYGGIFKEYLQIPFFSQLNEFIQNLYTQYEKQGYIQVPISGYKLRKSVCGEMKPQKLFNYLLQSYETALNIEILYQIVKLLRGYNSQIILYTYDSFLIDYDESEDILEDIQNIFKNFELNTTKIDGNSYDFNK